MGNLDQRLLGFNFLRSGVGGGPFNGDLGDLHLLVDDASPRLGGLD